MKLSRIVGLIKEVSINPLFINPVKLSLEVIQIRLAQRPRLRQRKFFQFVSNVHQNLIRGSEFFWYITMS